MHRSPEIAASLMTEDFLGVRQPVEILAGKTELDCAVQPAAIDRDSAFYPKFSVLFNLDVLDVDLRIVPCKPERTII